MGGTVMALPPAEGADRSWGVHVQHASAADAAVVIQVGRDLYLSDASLTGLWTPGGTAPGGCPFPGLDAFGPGQAAWFFGREELTAELVQRFDEALAAGSGGPVLVIGPSGAGKSSLLGAGLLAALGEGRLPAAGSAAWPRLFLTPGAHPLRTLRDAQASCAQAQGSTAARLVLVVDQTEEIFTACDDEAERSQFLDAIAALASAGGSAVVALGLRADFFARAAAYPVLREAMRSRQVLLGAMTAAEIRQAITRPAQAAGLTLESGLAERMLRDLGVEEGSEHGPGGYEPGRLPLLAHALRSTWLRRDGHRLTLAGYEASGGIHGAIAGTAEAAYGELDAAGQRAARQVFLGLVRVGEADEGTADTRRRVSAQSLYERLPDPQAAQEVLGAFTAARMLTSGGQAVEITHEALLRRWPRLREWIGEDRSGNLIRQRLEEAAAAWNRDGRDPSGLYGGIRLAAAQEWSGGRGGELSGPARAFLAASRQRRQRSIRRRNEIIAVLVALVIGLGGLAGYAFRQRAAARADLRQAESVVLQVQSAAALANHEPGTGMEFAVQAQRLEPSSPSALGALLSTQAVPYAGQLDSQDGTPIYSVAYSPDGRLIATGGSGYLALWRASDHRQLSKIDLRQNIFVHGVAFSPDGRLLAGTLPDGAGLWTVTDPAHPVLAGMVPIAAGAIAVAFSPDGRTLAAASTDRSVVLWNLASRSRERTITAAGIVTKLAFADGGRALVTAAAGNPQTGKGGPVQLWDLTAPARPALLLSDGPFGPGAVAVSPDGQDIAFAGSATRTASYPVQVWSLASRRLVATLTSPGVASVAFSPDGRLLAAGGIDDTVRLWDLQAGPVLLGTFSGHRQQVYSVVFSPDGATLASASQDGTVALWNVRGTTLAGRANPALAVAFSPDGRTMAVGVKSPAVAEVALYSMPAERLAAALNTGTEVSAIAFSPDGRLLAAALADPPASTVQIWNVATGQLTGRIQSHQAGLVTGLAFSPDGRLLATSGDKDPVVRLWDTRRLSLAATLGTVLSGDFTPPGTSALTFSPDGRLLAVAGEDGVTLLFDVSRRFVAGIYARFGPASSVAFSPNGRTLATGNQDGNVYLYRVVPTPSNARTGPFPAPEIALPASSQPISGLVFEPGGRTLIAAGWDGTIRLWNVTSRAYVPITAAAGQITGLAYSTSLGLIATANGNVTRIWQTSPAAVADRICGTLRSPVGKDAWHTYIQDSSYVPICG